MWASFLVQLLWTGEPTLGFKSQTSPGEPSPLPATWDFSPELQLLPVGTQLFLFTLPTSLDLTSSLCPWLYFPFSPDYNFQISVFQFRDSFFYLIESTVEFLLFFFFPIIHCILSLTISVCYFFIISPQWTSCFVSCVVFLILLGYLSVF